MTESLCCSSHLAPVIASATQGNDYLTRTWLRSWIRCRCCRWPNLAPWFNGELEIYFKGSNGDLEGSSYYIQFHISCKELECLIVTFNPTEIRWSHGWCGLQCSRGPTVFLYFYSFPQASFFPGHTKSAVINQPASKLDLKAILH